MDEILRGLLESLNGTTSHLFVYGIGCATAGYFIKQAIERVSGTEERVGELEKLTAEHHRMLGSIQKWIDIREQSDTSRNTKLDSYLDKLDQLLSAVTRK